MASRGRRSEETRTTFRASAAQIEGKNGPAENRRITMDGSSHIVCPHCDAINRVPRERLANHDAVGGRCGNCHEALIDRPPVTLETAPLERPLEKSEVPLLIR